jgi:hypothetical protein
LLAKTSLKDLEWMSSSMSDFDFVEMVDRRFLLSGRARRHSALMDAIDKAVDFWSDLPDLEGASRRCRLSLPSNSV